MFGDKKYQAFLEKALKMQCRFIGIKYSKKLFDSDSKFIKFTWSFREEERYRKWFIKTARKDLKISNSYAKMFWNYYYLVYAWDYRVAPNEKI